MKDQPRRLEYLHGIVKDFFVDWHKFKGKSVKHAMGAVARAREDYTFERKTLRRGGGEEVPSAGDADARRRTTRYFHPFSSISSLIGNLRSKFVTLRR